MNSVSSNPQAYPLWARCTGCMVAVASFLVFLIVSMISGAVPWQIGILAAGLSARGLTILTYPRAGSFWSSVMRDALAARRNRTPNESGPADMAGLQGSAGSRSIAAGTKVGV